MEAAGGRSGGGERGKAEAARTKPVVSRLKQQLVTLVEQVDQMRAAGGASVRGGDTDMDGASIIAPSSIDATASRAFRRRASAAAGSRRRLRKRRGFKRGSVRMSVESPGANAAHEGEEGARRMRTATWTGLASVSSRTRWISRGVSSGYSSYGADEYDSDDDETATRDDETHARSSRRRRRAPSDSTPGRPSCTNVCTGKHVAVRMVALPSGGGG